MNKGYFMFPCDVESLEQGVWQKPKEMNVWFAEHNLMRNLMRFKFFNNVVAECLKAAHTRGIIPADKQNVEFQ